MSNSLDSDQDKHSVCPDLGPNCLQRSSADNKSHAITVRLNYLNAGNFSCFLFSAGFFLINFFKKFFQMTSSLDPNKARHFEAILLAKVINKELTNI